MIILIYISTHRFKCRLHHIRLCLWRAAAITFFCCIQNQKNIRTIHSHFIFSLHTHDTQLTCYISLNWFFPLLLRNYSFFIHQMNCVCVCVWNFMFHMPVDQFTSQQQNTIQLFWNWASFIFFMHTQQPVNCLDSIEIVINESVMALISYEWFRSLYLINIIGIYDEADWHLQAKASSCFIYKSYVGEKHLLSCNLRQFNALKNA